MRNLSLYAHRSTIFILVSQHLCVFALKQYRPGIPIPGLRLTVAPESPFRHGQACPTPIGHCLGAGNSIKWSWHAGL